ncbi:hypothetical protein EDB89DRAFT_2065003 [Lactarius sanguifluus]|nr:hypothetical protein EDB89DRAFT_2065003 [Lactarius sanguifluus]
MLQTAYASLVWEHFQNSRREFEEFEWHLRCATLLFFNLLVTIYRLWLFSAWYLFTYASQAFLVKILIQQLSTVWFAVVPVFRYNVSNHVSPVVDLTSIRDLTPAWVLSIVGVIFSLALEATEVSIELARRANNGNGLVFDEWQNAHVSTSIEETVKIVDVSASGATIAMLYDPLPTTKNSQHHGGKPLAMTWVIVMPMGRAERLSTTLGGRKPTTVLHVRRI